MKTENINNQEGLRIISGEIANFQGISQKMVEVAGQSFVIFGKNAGGKSSVIRAFESVINSSSLPTKAIKEGEDSATVKLTVGGVVNGEEQEYTYKIRVTEEAAGKQKGVITVTDKEGNKIETRSVQKNILNYVSFDIDSFIRKGMTPEGRASKAGILEQIDILKSFMTQDDKVALHQLETEYEKIYLSRTDLNKEIDNIKASAKALPYTQEELTVFSADKTEEIAIIQSKQQDLANAIVEWSQNNDKLEAKRKRIETLVKEVVDLPKAQVAYTKLKPICDIDLVIEDGNPLSDIFCDIVKQVKLLGIDISHMESKKKQCAELTLEVTALAGWMLDNSRPSVEALNDKMTQLLSHQEKYREISSVEAKGIELKAKNEKSEAITKRLAEIKDEKKNLFAKSKLPVKGLTFDATGIYYNNLPFNSDHINSAEILSIGLAIAMAMNPTLRVVMIRNGSLIDKVTLKKMVGFCSKSGYQVILEVVDFSAESETEIVFTEKYLA